MKKILQNLVGILVEMFSSVSILLNKNNATWFCSVGIISITLAVAKFINGYSLKFIKDIIIEGLIETKFKVSQKELDDFLKNFPFNLVYSPTSVDNKLFDIRDKDKSPSYTEG